MVSRSTSLLIAISLIMVLLLDTGCANPNPPADPQVVARPGAGIATSPPLAPGSVPAASVPQLSGPSTLVTETPAPAPAGLNWVALGDSYSAGVGVPGGVGCSGGNALAAYPTKAALWFALTNSRQLASFKSHACGGATTAQVLNKQLDGVKDADIVTLTTGGNDIGFGQFATRCFGQNYLQGCPSQDLDSDVLIGPEGPHPDLHWAEVRSTLADAYVAIRKTMPARGQLFVLSYPVPVSLNNLSKCGAMSFLSRIVPGLGRNLLLANALAGRLDETIALALDDAANRLRGDHLEPNVHFVDWRTPLGAAWSFDNVSIDNALHHVSTNPGGICSDDPMTNFVKVEFSLFGQHVVFSNSFHPTVSGYQRGAGFLLDVLDQFDPSDPAQPHKVPMKAEACFVHGDSPADPGPCDPLPTAN